MISDAEADQLDNASSSTSGRSDHTSDSHTQHVPVIPEPTFDPPVQIWFGNLKTGVKPHLLGAISSKVKILGVVSKKSALCISLESTDDARELLDYYYEMMEGAGSEVMPWWKEVVVEIGDGRGTEPVFEEIRATRHQDRGDALIRGGGAVEHGLKRSNFNSHDSGSTDRFTRSVTDGANGGSTTAGQGSESLQLKVFSMEASSASAPERTSPDEAFAPLSPSTIFHSPSLSSSVTLLDSKDDTRLDSEPRGRLDVQSPVNSSWEIFPPKSSSTLHPLSTSNISTVPILIRNMPPGREDRLRSALHDLLVDSDSRIVNHSPVRFRTSVQCRNFVAFTEIQTYEDEATLLMKLNGRLIDGYRLRVQRANEAPQSSQIRAVPPTHAKNGKSSAITSSMESNTVAYERPSPNRMASPCGPTTTNSVRLFVDLNAYSHASQISDTYYQDKLQKLFEPYTKSALSFEMKFSPRGSRVAFVNVNSEDVSRVLRFLNNQFSMAIKSISRFPGLWVHLDMVSIHARQLFRQLLPTSPRPPPTKSANQQIFSHVEYRSPSYNLLPRPSEVH